MTGNRDQKWDRHGANAEFINANFGCERCIESIGKSFGFIRLCCSFPVSCKSIVKSLSNDPNR